MAAVSGSCPGVNGTQTNGGVKTESGDVLHNPQHEQQQNMSQDSLGSELCRPIVRHGQPFTPAEPGRAPPPPPGPRINEFETVQQQMPYSMPLSAGQPPGVMVPTHMQMVATPVMAYGGLEMYQHPSPPTKQQKKVRAAVASAEETLTTTESNNA
jgi:hypothetical protein